MTNKPKVSIVVPLFNRVGLIGETLDSICGQTYENWEAIVVDDGSTDGSCECVEKITLQEPRIKLYRRDRLPKGACTCRNIGIGKATGEFVVFLDSDDLLAAHCLEQRVKAMQENPGYDFLVFPILTFREDGHEKKRLFSRIFYQDYLTSFLLQSHWIITNPIWRKESLQKLDGFDEKLTCMQDGELHWRAIIEGMQFKVFKEKKYADSYIRMSRGHSRISHTNSEINLDTKVYAHQKVYRLLKEKKLLTPVRNSILAGQFLNISWKYNMMGKKNKSREVWEMVYKMDMVDKITYLTGKAFIQIRCSAIVRRSNLVAGALKRLLQPFLPKFLLWPK